MAVAAIALFTAMPAQPQSSYIPTRPGREPLPEGFVNLQSNITLALPFEEGEKPDAQVEAAQRTLYALAARQCLIAQDTIADECRVSNLSSTVNTQRMQRENSQIMVTAQVTMAVKLKQALSATKP
jgi:hypothetical protein